MEETQILPRSLLFRRYITSGPRCFDFYRCPGDLVYVELNAEVSNKLRASMKPPRKPISDEEKLEIFDYLLHRGGNPFVNLEKAEERLGRGFRILKKIDL